MAASMCLSVNVRLLLIWLAWLKAAGVSWSSNAIYGREHVKVSCTHSFTRTHLYKYIGVMVFITHSQPR